MPALAPEAVQDLADLQAAVDDDLGVALPETTRCAQAFNNYPLFNRFLSIFSRFPLDFWPCSLDSWRPDGENGRKMGENG